MVEPGYTRPARSRVIEGIVTSRDSAGRVNVAPMGPIEDEATPGVLVLRPFQDSRTFANRAATGQAVFPRADDVLVRALGAIGALDVASLEMRPADRVDGVIWLGAVSYDELRVRRLDTSSPRAVIEAEVVSHGTLRAWRGLNRAAHGVLEAAILATRVHLTGVDAALASIAPYEVWVEKTGGDAEREAMRRVIDAVASGRDGEQDSAATSPTG